jgi:1-acyl-sn-glycerol-3-phosphate acyltransferase
VADGVSELVPGDERAWFRKGFSRWLRGHFAKRFHAVRLASGTRAMFEAAAAHEGPIVVLCNHQSWWDPLVGFLAHDRWFGDRPSMSPMDATQLAKFRFFRKLGVFGVDPDAATGLRPFVRYVGERFAAAPRAVLMMTPQGEFVDPRRPVVIRPGAAMVAARHPEAQLLAVAIEYAFWTDQRPEVFMRAVRVASPAVADDVRAWQEAIESAMNANASALALLVQGRDPAAFEAISGGGAGQIHPVYDVFLRLTGRRTSIETAHRAKGTP